MAPKKWSCCSEHLLCLVLHFQAKMSCWASRTSQLAVKLLGKPGQVAGFYFSEISQFGFMCVSEMGLKATDSNDILWRKWHSFEFAERCRDAVQSKPGPLAAGAQRLRLCAHPAAAPTAEQQRHQARVRAPPYVNILRLDWNIPTGTIPWGNLCHGP